MAFSIRILQVYCSQYLLYVLLTAVRTHSKNVSPEQITKQLNKIYMIPLWSKKKYKVAGDWSSLIILSWLCSVQQYLLHAAMNAAACMRKMYDVFSAPLPTRLSWQLH